MIEIKRIIPESQISKLEFESYLIGVVKKKYTSEVVRRLRQLNLQSANEKSFIKRVKKMDQPDSQNVRVVLSLKQQTEKIKGLLQELKQAIVETYYEQLPKNPPITKEQYQQWTKYWPVTLIEPEAVKQISHSEEELQFIQFLTQKIAEQKTDFILFQIQTKRVLITETGKCNPGTVRHPVMRLLEQWPNVPSFKAKIDTPEQYYYLTGLRMIMNRNICGMCKMALVHSRLERVYFLQGVFNQKPEYIFWEKKLNHKINMFRIKINQEQPKQKEQHDDIQKKE